MESNQLTAEQIIRLEVFKALAPNLEASSLTIIAEWVINGIPPKSTLEKA